LLIRGSRTTPTRTDRRTGRPRTPSVQRQGILCVQPQAVGPGKCPERVATGELAQHTEPWLQQLERAAELVDHKPGDQGLVGGFQQRHGAVQGREHPAPVDVTDHDHRQVRGPRQSHVRDVGGAQVDLGRAARSLADHHVVLAPKLGQAVQGEVQQPGRVLPVLDRVDFSNRAAEHHHLAAPVAAWLEQHRVHPRLGLDARRGGLHHLGPADLRAVAGDERVQRHVLRLERGDPHPLPGQPAAQAGSDHALARIRGRACYQKRPC
jgi:hypothetical protein